ncbi:Rha family transcriptional regulator [Clostridium sp.]|uniref:Rha family transcriptional regulator n=1 Tax=Clostridium sp. TaxID=1506 RepID=UPI0035A0AB07
MTDLENINNGMLTIDSRDVAKMMELPHYEVLKKLEGTSYPDGRTKQVGIIPTLTKGNIPVSDYFTRDVYTDSTGKSNTCYQCTKMGCEMLANKLTGEKGILFTAKYVEKFNAMEQKIKVPALKSNSKAGGLNGLLKTLNGVMKEEKIIAHKRAEVLKDVAGQCGIIIPDDFVKKPAFVQVVLNLPVE